MLNNKFDCKKGLQISRSLLLTSESDATGVKNPLRGFSEGT